MTVGLTNPRRLWSLANLNIHAVPKSLLNWLGRVPQKVTEDSSRGCDPEHLRTKWEYVSMFSCCRRRYMVYMNLHVYNVYSYSSDWL